MKKQILGIIVVAVIAVAAGWNFNQSKNKTAYSELTLANLEALANSNESSNCPNGCLTTKGTCNCNGEHPYKEATWK